MAESPSTHGHGLRETIAGLGFLVAATGAQAETPQHKVGETTETVAAQVTDCVADGKTFRKEWLVARAKEEGVTRAAIKAWFEETMKGEDFKNAMSARFNACEIANNELVKEQQLIRLAQLGKRIAAAQAVFAQNGFEMREDDDGQVALYREGRLAAYFAQVPDEAAEINPLTGERPTKWGLDFSPLEAWNAEVVADTAATQADTARLEDVIEDAKAERQQIQQRMEEIWKEIETRALGGEKTAELSAPILRPPISATYRTPDGRTVEVRS